MFDDLWFISFDVLFLTSFIELYFGVSIQFSLTFLQRCFCSWNRTNKSGKHLNQPFCAFLYPCYTVSKKGLTTLRFWQAGEYDTSFRSPLTSQRLGRVGSQQDARLVSRCHCGRCKLTLNFQDFKAPLRCYCSGCRHFHSSSFGAYLPLETLPDWQTGAPWIKGRSCEAKVQIV